MFDWLFKRDHCPEEEEGGGVDRLVLDTYAQRYWEGGEGTLALGSPGRQEEGCLRRRGNARGEVHPA